MDRRNVPGESSGRPAMEEWQIYHAKSLPELDAIKRRIKGPADVAIMRASQIDAGRLDTELTSMLEEQFLKAFSILQPRVLNALRPELSLLLDFLIFRFSIWKGRPTPGLALMNLRYRNERGKSHIGGRTGVEGQGLSSSQKVFWGLSFVLGKYIWNRLETITAAYHWADQPEDSSLRKAWRWLQRLETAYKMASFANFTFFLYQGRYRSVVERVLGSRLVYKRASQPRALSFEYLNRQLVWHEISELVLFILPLINVEKIKKAVLKILPQKKTIQSSTGSEQQDFNSLRGCQICKRKDMILPCQAQPCMHTFCYYCLTSHTEHEVGYKCPKCDTVVSSVKRWSSVVPE